MLKANGKNKTNKHDIKVYDIPSGPIAPSIPGGPAWKTQSGNKKNHQNYIFRIINYNYKCKMSIIFSGMFIKNTRYKHQQKVRKK